jgi:phosphonate transport system ATP-binding protein
MSDLQKAATGHEVTTLVSLHQVNIAAHFGDRFLGFKDGRLAFDVDRTGLTHDVIDDLYGDVETVGLPEERTSERKPPTADRKAKP